MQACQSIQCSVGDILQRITPIEFIDGVLVIQSPLSVEEFLQIGGVSMDGSNGVLRLSEGTTVGGVPLLCPQYVGATYQLPSKTNISGFRISEEHFFNYFTANVYASGAFINNNSASFPSTYAGDYPFFVPQDCTLTSLRFSIALGTGASSSISNVVATIYKVSLTNVQTSTGVSATIPGPLTVNSRNYAETTFQYPITKGYSVGVRVTYSGSTGANITTFAVLGYKFS